MTINKVFYKSPHNYDLDAESNTCSVKDFGPSLTVQSMAEDTDINMIMKRFGITGQMPSNPRIPSYMDLGDNKLDYRTALNYIQAADDAFMEYPAQLRAKFNNNPQQFLDYCQDPANLTEMRTLGLAKPLPPEPPTAPPPPAPAPTK